MEGFEKLLENSKEILTVSSKALLHTICNRCLGRLFARSGYGLDNEERGRSIRIFIALSHELLADHESLIDLGFEEQLPVHSRSQNNKDNEIEVPEDEGWETAGTPSIRSFIEGEQEGECWLCHDVFNSIHELARLTLERSRELEFNSFLIGCKIDPGTSERERKLWEECNPTSAEPIKEELNREIGKLFGMMAPDKDFDRKGPEVVFLVDPLFKNVDLNIKPIFLKGRYNKFVRGIPQTRWICRSCRGRGCEKCGGKGKMYETSVEELIGAPIMDEALGTNFKLHGMGREDIDVLALGNGRPFILEISGPMKRMLDLHKIVDRINTSSDGKIKVSELVNSQRSEVPLIKEGTSRKRYRARISIVGDVQEETLKYNISLLAQSPIDQRTPRRVSHRRADKVRHRKVHEISAVMENDGTVVVDLTTDGGLYIKELFHGDDGRTNPSLSSLLGLDVSVESLDVLDVLDGEDA